jgi:hypothetical protein
MLHFVTYARRSCTVKLSGQLSGGAVQLTWPNNLAENIGQAGRRRSARQLADPSELGLNCG